MSESVSNVVILSWDILELKDGESCLKFAGFSKVRGHRGVNGLVVFVNLPHDELGIPFDLQVADGKRCSDL